MIVNLHSRARDSISCRGIGIHIKDYPQTMKELKLSNFVNTHEENNAAYVEGV